MDMPDATLKDLLASATLAFTGTVTAARSSSVAGFPTDDRTAVVTVREVLKAPAVLAHLAGATVTVQLAPALPALGAGESASFFTDALAYGDGVAVRELARLPAEVPAGQAGTGVASGRGRDAAAALRELAQEEIIAHARDADAVVRGYVVAMEAAPQNQAPREHDPHWWVATLAVDLVEKGGIPLGVGAQEPVPVRVLYANSLDHRWRDALKPKAGQSGLWLLHRTDGPLAEIAPFQVLHRMDLQPSLQLDLIRGQGG
jgi:hypothetical protein